jgi:hypothetical protein
VWPGSIQVSAVITAHTQQHEYVLSVRVVILKQLDNSKRLPGKQFVNLADSLKMDL